MGRGGRRALVPLLQKCAEPLRPQELASALTGLQHKGDSPEIRAVLTVLTERMPPFVDPTTVAALQGIQDIGDSAEVAGPARTRSDGPPPGNSRPEELPKTSETTSRIKATTFCAATSPAL